MGAIRRRGSSGAVEHLYQDHTVGRAPSCRLVLDHRVVSVHHASIRWLDGCWTVRDLGSRNGVFINGLRMTEEPDGGAVQLQEGDQIMFATAEETWELVDASEPQPLLVPVEPSAAPVRLEEHDMLVLPSPERPSLTIYKQREHWWLEREGDAEQIEDGQQIVVGAQRYRAMLTGTLEPTLEARARLVSRWVENLTLELLVERDEESAAVRARVGDTVHELPQRAIFYLLAFLARRRWAEAENEPDAGWVDVDTACRELGLSSADALGLYVYRCRKAIKACGVEDPAALIDRSRRRHLRIGIPAEQLSVKRLG